MTPRSCRYHFNARRSRSGFALIITIILMAFLVLLMVSMATLTRVETQVAANYQQQDLARQNALMALNLALGHLQAAAGPDQRVTARADILDPNTTVTPSTTPILNNTTVKQPLWTGVWKTANPANPTWNLDVSASGASGNFLRHWSTINSATATTRHRNTNMYWLVSGAQDPATNTSFNPVDWVATPSNSVVLAKTKLTPTATTTLDTAVPLVELQSTPPGFNQKETIGKYAYWVADEGVKARINIKTRVRCRKIGQLDCGLGRLIGIIKPMQVAPQETTKMDIDR